MLENLRYLLLQVRDHDDPMRTHEVDCFVRSLHCSPEQLCVVDLLRDVPTPRALKDVDIVLLGGSGDYSVARGGSWIGGALDAMRELHATAKPTFASCWGFQAMAKALGGEVVTDLSRAEVGTHEVQLTAAGEGDPVLGPLGRAFRAQMGHQDIVDRLPEGTVLLATTARSTNQAFRFNDKPIYCTQFHPELNRALLLDRLRTYPEYIERIAGVPFDAFVETCTESPETEDVILRFVKHVTEA
ncbi:MAG: type 1 glutamine amidotransferase [Planctomycetota bacterium]